MSNKNSPEYKIGYYLTGFFICSIFTTVIAAATALLIKGLLLFFKLLF